MWCQCGYVSGTRCCLCNTLMETTIFSNAIDGGGDPVNESDCSDRTWEARDRIETAVRTNISDKFRDMFVDIFMVDVKKEWPDRFMFKDFTARNRVQIIQSIPSFVDKEFEDDMLLQSMPVLSACLRVVYMLRENDHKDGKRPKKSRLRRDEVLEILTCVVDNYIVDCQDGIEVMGRIIEKKCREAGLIEPVV